MAMLGIHLGFRGVYINWLAGFLPSTVPPVFGAIPESPRQTFRRSVFGNVRFDTTVDTGLTCPVRLIVFWGNDTNQPQRMIRIIIEI